MFGCVRACDIDSMAEMVSYGDRVYCVACCDSVSKILYLHKDDARSNKHKIHFSLCFPKALDESQDSRMKRTKIISLQIPYLLVG